MLSIVIVWSALGGLLCRIQFVRTLENLNIETALEARRDGHWLRPTLEGLARTKKPPLTAWITALAIRPQTVQDCSSPDPGVRAHAYASLAWECRWPALAQACAALLAIYWLGCIVADASIGASASLLAASCYLFLRYAQVGQTDISLTLWVTVANALLALAVVRKRWWIGMVGGGAAVGLAFLAKGPVALLETALPWIVWKILGDRRMRWPITPIFAGIASFTVVGLPWYVLVLLHDPQHQSSTWFKEVTGTDAPDRGETVFQYLLYLLEFAPPLIFAVPAAVLAIRHRRQSPGSSPPLAMLCLILTPLIVMSFFKDKKDRYLLPLVGPIAILAAVGLAPSESPGRGAEPAGAQAAAAPSAEAQQIVHTLYRLALAAIPIVFAFLAMLGEPKIFRGFDARPWLNHAIAAAAIAISLLMLLLALRTQPRFTSLFTLLFMAILMHLLTLGYYLHSSAGQSKMFPLAQRIWAEYPAARMLTTMPAGQRASEDLSIYMNRTTGWITPREMTEMHPDSRPIVVLIRQRDAEPPIHLPPPWRDFFSFPKEPGETWRTVVLPAVQNNPTSAQAISARVR